MIFNENGIICTSNNMVTILGEAVNLSAIADKIDDKLDFIPDKDIDTKRYNRIMDEIKEDIRACDDDKINRLNEISKKKVLKAKTRRLINKLGALTMMVSGLGIIPSDIIINNDIQNKMNIDWDNNVARSHNDFISKSSNPDFFGGPKEIKDYKRPFGAKVSRVILIVLGVIFAIASSLIIASVISRNKQQEMDESTIDLAEECVKEFENVANNKKLPDKVREEAKEKAEKLSDKIHKAKEVIKDKKLNDVGAARA